MQDLVEGGLWGKVNCERRKNNSAETFFCHFEDQSSSAQHSLPQGAMRCANARCICSQPAKSSPSKSLGPVVKNAGCETPQSGPTCLLERSVAERLGPVFRAVLESVDLGTLGRETP